MVELETTKRQIHLAGSVGKSNLILTPIIHLRLFFCMSDWKNKQFYYVCPLVWQYPTNVDFLGAYWGYFYALASLGNNSGAQLILEWA